MRDHSQRVLDLAQGLGASYADVRLETKRVQVVSVKNGAVDALADEESAGFGVRVLVDGAWGFASSARVEPAELERVTRLAVAIARASGLARRQPISLGPPVRSVGRYATPIRRDPFAVSLEDKLDLLFRADAAMRAVRGIGVAEASLECQRIDKTFASTDGAYVEQALIETGGGIEALAVGEQEVQKRSYPNSFGRHQGTAGYEFVEAMDLAGNAPRIAEEAVQLLGARQCPSEVTTLILDPTQTALQVHESCGHPIELDRVLGMEAAYAGTSFLTFDKLGSRYGSELVNINADAKVAGGLGTFGYDDEGVPAQNTPVVEA